MHFANKIFVDAEGIAGLFLGLILVVRLIQSQGKARAASTCGHVDPDGFLFLAGKERIQFLTGAVGQFDHTSSMIRVFY